MRHLKRIALIAALLALVALLAACSGTPSSGELTSDESDVPAGMPVMYEFFTLS